MFADHPLRKKAFLEETKTILHSGHIGIVSKGLTHDFVQKLEKFHLSLILDKWALKLCLMIIQVKNKPSYTIQILILHSGHIEIFSKGLTHDFGRRLEISYLLVFGQT